MRKKIFKNWGLKLVSLILAFILWFLVVQIDDPIGTIRFNNITVRLTNTELLDEENKVYEVLDNTDSVNVTVSAPRSIREQLRASDIVAEADISKLTDINTVAITYSVNYEIDSIEGDHDAVRLSVEDRSSKWVRLQTDTVGEVADGYMVASATPDQTLIEVTGPESVIESISYAAVEIDVTGATNSLSANVDVQLYDGDGNLVDSASVRKNVSYVRIEVEILAVKTVPIELNVAGEPQEGYLVTGVTESSPASIQIAGSAYTLSGISRISIPEEELDISGATENFVKTIDIRDYLPENVSLADSSYNGRVTATVYIEPQVEKTLEIPAENISLVNAPEGVDVQLQEDYTTYTLNVYGLDAYITPLEESAVRGTVDIGAWMADEEREELSPGTYFIPITFDLAEEVNLESRVYARVVVTRLEEQ